MIRTLGLFCFYFLIEIIITAVIYYCTCSIGMMIFDGWPERLFWVAGVPVLIGILMTGCVLYLIVYGIIWIVAANWKEARRDSDRYRQRYHE